VGLPKKNTGIFGYVPGCLNKSSETAGTDQGTERPENFLSVEVSLPLLSRSRLTANLLIQISCPLLGNFKICSTFGSK